MIRNHIGGRSLIAQRSCGSHDHRFDFDPAIQGHPHPWEKILVGLTGLKSWRITFATAIPSRPDRRRGITLCCMILNGAVKVQPSPSRRMSSGDTGDKGQRANTQACSRREYLARTQGGACMDPRSRLDFDWGKSKIAPDSARICRRQRQFAPGAGRISVKRRKSDHGDRQCGNRRDRQ